MQPLMTEDTMELISNAYAMMRSKQGSQSRANLPVTPRSVNMLLFVHLNIRYANRSLETIIRLSSAHAKVLQAK
jgi:DNA replicative helicase MCM subunit Mcm2 (Cdc46/Mcm family)